MLHSDVFMEIVHEWAVRLKEMDRWGHDGQSCCVHTLDTNNHCKHRQSCCRLTSEYVFCSGQHLNRWMTQTFWYIHNIKKKIYILVQVLKNNSTTYIVFLSSVCVFILEQCHSAPQGHMFSLSQWRIQSICHTEQSEQAVCWLLL